MKCEVRKVSLRAITNPLCPPSPAQSQHMQYHLVNEEAGTGRDWLRVGEGPKTETSEARVKGCSVHSDNQSRACQGHWRMLWSMVTLGVTLQEQKETKGPAAGSCVEQVSGEAFAKTALTRDYFTAKRLWGKKNNVHF